MENLAQIRKLLKDGLRAKDIADELGVTLDNVYTWVSRGRIKAYKVGKELRFYKEDFDEFLREYVHSPGRKRG